MSKCYLFFNGGLSLEVSNSMFDYSLQHFRRKGFALDIMPSVDNGLRCFIYSINSTIVGKVVYHE